VSREPVAHHVAISLEENLDLAERQLERAKAPDRDRGFDLGRVVIAVAVVRVDPRRDEQADLFVVTERLGGQAGRACEASDGQHGTHDAASCSGKVK
jgi:hypothetical protein